MRRAVSVIVLAALLAGSAIGAMPGQVQAQGYAGYTYPPPPQNPYATPWVGPNTPWTYYNGDWFLNGVLYYFFGPQQGWAPYYSYAPVYIVRPTYWYAPMWQAWYQGHPHYVDVFVRQYPYWRSHKNGHVYDQNFYNAHHRGQGNGWQKGFKDTGGNGNGKGHPHGTSSRPQDTGARQYHDGRN